MAPDLTGPAWILAGEQTGGRGRRGRPWVSPKGNFHASLVMRPEGPPKALALRSFAAALALRDACVALTGMPDAFTFKWPNDVLLNGGKLAGILLESQGQGGKIGYLAVGIGINLIAAPSPEQLEAGALTPVSMLAETGKRILPEHFLEALAPAFAHWDGVLSVYGFAPLRNAWLTHATRLGEPIRARTGQKVHEGTFETIDMQGALILQTDSGRLAIPAADVFF